MAAIAFRSVEKIVKVVTEIKEAVETARQNREEAADIQECVETIEDVVSELDEVDLTNNQTMNRALANLHKTLHRALKLIKKCEKENKLRLLCAARNLSKQLLPVQDDILRKLLQVILAVSVHITKRFGKANPRPPRPQGVEEVKITNNGHHSTGDARFEKWETKVETGVEDQLTKDEAENPLRVVEDPFATLSRLIREFSLSEMKAATNDFSNDRVIGKGGFGTIYKGELSDGLVVAVKKLQAMRNNNTETEFVDELTLGAKLKHENVVKYLGYCMDVTTRSVEYNGQNILAECHTYLLVLEYLPNGSLQDIINEERRVEWPFCYRVIQEIAQGVHYLHEQRVIHSDLKPDNIRFDTRMNPVITDFGISTILPPDDDEIILDRRNGTIGYMAPEMFIDYRLSKKADVFAFGICLLKTIMSTSTSKKCWHDREEWDEMLKEAGGLKGLLHPTVQVDESQLIEMNRCLEVGWLCSDYKPEKRPTMAKAIEMLTQKKRRNKGRVWFDRL